MKAYKYISDITDSELEKNCVIPCVNELNLHCILIKNFSEKNINNDYSTDNLNIRLNGTLLHLTKKFYFHIITAKKNDPYSLEQFNVIYEYIFKKIVSPIEDSKLSILITSLEEYFKTPPDPDRRSLQIGVYGELLSIQFLYNFGYFEILKKY